MRYLEFKLDPLSEAIISEVSMSPSTLSKWSKSKETTGMLMGIEFELYVPDTATEERDSELNYDDYDEEVSDISDIVSFFRETESASRLTRQLQEEYSEWLEENVMDYISNNWDEDIFRDKLTYQFDVDEFNDEAKDQLKNKEDVTEEDIDNLASELLADAVYRSLKTEDQKWQDAMDEYNNELANEATENIGESDWLNYLGVSTASDAERQFELSWPHYDSGSGETDTQSIADRLQSDLGLKVVAGVDWHDVKRTPEKWIVEPDSSLDDPDDDTDGGAEIISPPLPMDEMLSEMNRIWDWAKKNKCYTNHTTGLHMNVSVPNFSYEKLDYIKLALFLGDRFILEQFNRASNRMCRSAITKIRDNLNNYTKIEQVLELMRSNLNSSVSKIIHSGAVDKYTSIHPKNGYVEFRGPGGDWLGKDFNTLVSTLLRTARALSIACDENAYRQEYAKKFYKLVSPNSSSVDTVSLFSKYTSGTISKDQLKSLVKNIQSDRSDEKHLRSGGLLLYTVSLSSANFTVEATGPENARQIARDLGIKFEIDNAVRNLWRYAVDESLTVVRGRPPQGKERTMFKFIKNDGTEETFVLNDMRHAMAWILRHDYDRFKNVVSVQNLNTSEIQQVPRPTPNNERTQSLIIDHPAQFQPPESHSNRNGSWQWNITNKETRGSVLRWARSGIEGFKEIEEWIRQNVTRGHFYVQPYSSMMPPESDPDDDEDLGPPQ